MSKRNKPDWTQLVISIIGLVTAIVTLWTSLHAG
jgi:hypothetical protein